MGSIKIVALLEKNSGLSHIITSLLATYEVELLILENCIEEILRMDPNLVLVSLTNQFEDSRRIAYKINETIQEKNIPLLVITDKSHPYDKIPGLFLPLDMRCDYVAYPFEAGEFLTKVEQLIRR